MRARPGLRPLGLFLAACTACGGTKVIADTDAPGAVDTADTADTAEPADSDGTVGSVDSDATDASEDTHDTGSTSGGGLTPGGGDTSDTSDTGPRPFFDPPAGEVACRITPSSPGMSDSMTVTAVGLTDADTGDTDVPSVRYDWWTYQYGTVNRNRDPRGHQDNYGGLGRPKWGATRPSCEQTNYDVADPSAPLFNCYAGSEIYARCIAFDSRGDGQVVEAEIVTIAGTVH